MSYNLPKKAIKYDKKAILEDVVYFKMRARMSKSPEARKKYLKLAAMLERLAEQYQP